MEVFINPTQEELDSSIGTSRPIPQDRWIREEDQEKISQALQGGIAVEDAGRSNGIIQLWNHGDKVMGMVHQWGTITELAKGTHSEIMAWYKSRAYWLGK